MSKPCEVPWCAAMTNDGRYCPIHAKRPARYGEDVNRWLTRLRAEDKAAEKEAAKKALESAS